MESVRALARAGQQGDVEAFQILVKRFQDMAFALAFVRLGDEMLAQDAAQESFIEAYLHIQTLDQPEAFAGWLRRIVLRRCSRILRATGPQGLPVETIAEFPANDPGPIEKLLGDEQNQRVKEAIASLPEHQQTVTVLHYISGYSQHEIADFLEVSGATVRKRLQYARERLRERLSDMKEEYFERRPSKGEEFSNRVRFFIAVRTGDMDAVLRQLDKDPTLVSEQERWGETLAELYPRAQPSEHDRNALSERSSGWTALEWAVWFGDIEMVRVLLEHGASPHHLDWRGISVLSLAVGQGHIEIARLLLEHGVDPNGNTHSKPPIFAAIAEGKFAMVEFLLQNGADPTVRDRHGRTTLHWAAIGSHQEIVQLLLEHGVDKDAVDSKGRSVEWWVQREGESRVLATLNGKVDSQATEGSPEGALLAGQLPVRQATGIPVGPNVAGRILNAKMEPIDGEGQISAPRLARLEPSEKSVVDVPREKHYALGIKPLDLLTPVPENGILSLIAAWGVGKIVLMHELMRTMKVVKGGRSVIVTVTGGPRELDVAAAAYKETGVLDSCTVILVPKDASQQERRNAFLAGLTMARYIAEVEKLDVLFAVDQLALDAETAPMLKQAPSGEAGSILTILSGYVQDELDSNETLTQIEADARVVFSSSLSRRGLYPAVDPLESWSTVLEESVLGERHVRIAREVRELLGAARNLSEAQGNEPQTKDDTRTIERAGRVERFLTQPFYVAQLHNGIPGEQVSIESMLDGFEAILAGEYDSVPLKSLSYIGSLDGIKDDVNAA